MKSLRYLFAAAVFALSLPCVAKDEKKGPPLFDSKEVLEVEIKSDFPKVNTARADQEKVYPSTLTYKEDGKTVTLDIGLSARGGLRANICDFGPMRITLPEKKEGPDGKKIDPTDGTLFEHSKNKIRLVTHCQPNTYRNPDMTLENFVVTEYMLYQIAEATGFPHLKTRLARAKYIYNSGKLFDEGYLIFLENAEDMAQRYGLEEAENFPGHVPVEGQAAFDVTLRLVANEADHNHGSTHNGFIIGEKLAKDGEDFKPESMVSVPYDFVLYPNVFPYSDTRDAWSWRGKNLDWFSYYEDEHRDLTEQLKSAAKQVVSNRERIRQAMNSTPYPNPQDVKEKVRMEKWVDEFVKAAEAYVGGR